MIKNLKLLKVKEFRMEGRICSYYRNIDSSKEMRILAKMEAGAVWILFLTKVNSDVRPGEMGLVDT